MKMKNPIHPGKLLKHDCIEALGVSVTEAAKALGVTRPTLSKILNCKAAISPEMAIRISRAFGGTPDVWLSMQMGYDLARAEARTSHLHIKRFHLAAHT